MIRNKLNIKRGWAKVLPKSLTEDQKDNWKDICFVILKRLKKQTNLPENVIISYVMKYGFSIWFRNKMTINALKDSNFVKDQNSSNEQV